jgi:hypothetical protein
VQSFVVDAKARGREIEREGEREERGERER